MASTTRSPSPTSDASPPSSPQLTPRSKLKAELAALDDSSDEDTGPIGRKSLFKTAEKSIRKIDSPIRRESFDVAEEDNEDEDDEDEDVIRPRGRLAARMQFSNTENRVAEPSSPQSVPETRKKSTSPTLDSGAQAESDEDEAVPAAPHRRRIRTAREATPEATTDRAASPVSPGLFVSPNKSQHSNAGSDSDNDLPANLAQNARFKALVARKREERLVKEAEEKAKREEKRAQRVEVSDDEDNNDDVSDISDDDGGRKLTQEVSSRPAVRKASKKALEEMNRETQRLSRSMQLAHEAKTKKKISKSALFERFNFKVPGLEAVAETTAEVIPAISSSRPTTPGSVKDMDAEMADKDTPPSSPPSASRKTMELPILPPVEVESQEDGFVEGAHEKLPSLDDLFTQAKRLHKGRGKATLAGTESPKKTPTKPRRQVRVKFPAVQANLATIDLDDDLQIVKPKKQSKLDTLFSRIPADQKKEGTSVHDLRGLAHLSSPPQDARKRGQKHSMTVGELQLNLQQRARAQAKLERARRVELLKAKGIHVQTSEEREKEREEVEDIVARARQEAEEIMAREREDAKKAKAERKANGEDDHLDWDDSDDDDESFAGSDGEQLQPIEEGELDFSGSDEDGGDEDGESEGADDEDESAGNPMFDEAAEEADDSEHESVQAATDNLVDNAKDEEMDDIQPTMSKSRRRKRNVQILSDDEAEATVEATPKAKNPFRSPTGLNSDSPKVPTSVLRSATKTFIPGLPIPAAGPAGLGLTQIFAGTMDDSQAASAPPATGSPMQFMPSFNNFPGSQFSASADETQPAEDLVMDSQTETQKRETQTQGIQLHFEQSQMHGFGSLMQLDATQASDILEATQDAGFGDYTPMKQRFVDPPQGTVDTVLLNGTPVFNADADTEIGPMESPLVRRRGKLRSKGQVSFTDSELPATEEPESPVVQRTVPTSTAEPSNTTEDDQASAFRLMAKAARKKKRALEKFNRKKSRAKEMVHGEADESEDEYAGLGGADGEDSSEADEDDLAELRKQMIDDESKGLTEEEQGKLAALFADRERAADSAQVDKLFRDITTGMLRKRRRGGGGGNGDFDLSDSDDGGEARRRLKRKQFAKMQKALFADERIGKIAENPRNSAFMKSIEDWGSDEEMGFDEPFFPAEEDSQNQGESQNKPGEGEESIPDSQPTSAETSGANVGRKRTRIETSDPAMRPPPNLRRTRDGVKPASLADVRRSLSSLLGEPNMSSDSIIPATDPHGSDSEGENERAVEGSESSNKENRSSGYVSVVDRITLKRSGSSNLSANSKLAFAAQASASTGGGTFKVPALLRRATTNSSLISQSSNVSSTGVTIGAGGTGAGGKSSFGDEGKLKKNAGKKSGINFFARENERREKLKETERRREEKKWKGAEGRSKAVGGLFGGGRFE